MKAYKTTHEYKYKRQHRINESSAIQPRNRTDQRRVGKERRADLGPYHNKKKKKKKKQTETKKSQSKIYKEVEGNQKKTNKKNKRPNKMNRESTRLEK